jgi:hypothetical protein
MVPDRLVRVWAPWGDEVVMAISPNSAHERKLFRHSGAWAQPASPESIITKLAVLTSGTISTGLMDSGLAPSARPGMTAQRF